MENQSSNLSILMFPWLAHGHISPFLELARKLAQRNFTIYLCSTPATLISSVKKKLSDGENFSEKIKLIELHLPVLPDLPPHYHTTNGLPPHLMPTLKKAFNMAGPNFCEILKTLKPDLLIYDSLQPWAPKAALDINIPAVDFITSSSVMTAFMFHAYENPGMKFPYNKIFYRNYEAVFARELQEDLKKHRNVEKIAVLEGMEQSCGVILIKGFSELDGKYRDYLSNLCGKKVVAVGPLVQEPTQIDEIENSDIIKWLNKKEKRSTVFVSFGSEYFLSKEDRQEIAYGLEKSRVNFIWVIRFPKGKSLKLEEALPEGFLKRVGDRGMVLEGWAPQAKILSHSSIGGFVSHCGWSSILESLKYGVPIIATPMHLDQPINARLVGEIGAGLEVLKTHDGRISHKKLTATIRQMMNGESGEIVRKQAKNLSLKIEEKGEEEIDRVVEELVQLCLRNKNNKIGRLH
ncbi:hypothetical protein M9H77_36749 [Catharanthus roseus]|uniref:Uncharacterized protein n=1 Tax=Catharanthus roseus TaxID=4058 RepID=A0ACB9ZUI8_CATRO|nr:hypothetical protein M9H77_36749 [Catharanthus roseus]